MGCVVGRCCSCLIFPAPHGAEDEAEWAEFRESQGENLVWLTTTKGEEHPALYIRPPGGSAQLTVLFSHGNAEDITQMYPKFELLAREYNISFFLYEYSGYSLSSGGRASEKAFYRNIRAAFKHLTEVYNVPRAQIVLWGRSIGSGPTVHLASLEQGLAGMLLESGLASACRFQGCLGAACTRLFCCGLLDFFDNQSKLRKVDCPTMLIHGTADRVVHCSNSRHNHTQLQQPMPPYYVEGAGHNDVDTLNSSEYNRQMRKFFGKMSEESHKRMWGGGSGTTSTGDGATDLAASMAARRAP